MKRSTLAWTFALLGCLATAAAVAQSVRKTAEASVLVTGSVEVNPDGTLLGYILDQPEKLPPGVIDVIGKSITHWQFKLSAPTKDVVKSTMSVRVVARPAGEGKYNVVVEGASFGQHQSSAATVSAKDQKPPRYPQLAIQSRVSGNVYMLVRVGRDGTVEDAIAEQVNLEQYASPRDMEKFRKMLADASVEAARRWTFTIPTEGTSANDPYWVVRVPVNFSLGDFARSGSQHPYGSWEGYIPGPRQTAPWINQALANQSPDAVPDGALATGNSQLQLATRLDGA